MKDLVLFGAGGLAREAMIMLKFMNMKEPAYNLLGCLVDEKYYRPGSELHGFPILGTEEWMLEHKDTVLCCCAIGTPSARARVQTSLTEQGVTFATLIHPNVYIPPSTTIGSGCIIQSDNRISADCVIDDGVFLNTCCTVGHDVTIGAYTCIMTGTGISGWCKIGREVNIGGHAYIVPKRKIGDSAAVAAGSVVFSNVKAGTTVLGNPAKRMACLE